MTWKTEEIKPERKQSLIRCFTCKKFVPSKRHLKEHMGHDVHYTDAKGEAID